MSVQELNHLRNENERLRKEIEELKRHIEGLTLELADRLPGNYEIVGPKIIIDEIYHK